MSRFTGPPDSWYDPPEDPPEEQDDDDFIEPDDDDAPYLPPGKDPVDYVYDPLRRYDDV